MIDFFCNIYNGIHNNNAILNRLKIYSLERIFVRILAKCCLSIYFFLTRNVKKYSVDLNNEVIVSLTSFPARINDVWIVIETMLRQTYRPQKICLWLSQEQFSSKHQLPKRLLALEKRGLEIYIVPKDIKSHKKYYYAFKLFKHELIFLIDDDIIYNTNILKDSLMEYNRQGAENIIIANYGNEIKYIDNRIADYTKWPSVHNRTTKDNLFFGSGGGTLLKPSSLYCDVFNIDLALGLAPLADDVWLNAMSKLNRNIVTILDNGHLLTIYNCNTPKLYKQNIDEGKNDRQIKAVQDFYEQFGVSVF